MQPYTLQRGRRLFSARLENTIFTWACGYNPPDKQALPERYSGVPVKVWRELPSPEAIATEPCLKLVVNLQGVPDVVTLTHNLLNPAHCLIMHWHDDATHFEGMRNWFGLAFQFVGQITSTGVTPQQLGRRHLN